MPNMIPCLNHQHILKPTLVCYIYQYNQKDKPSEKDLSLLKNDIPNNLADNRVFQKQNNSQYDFIFTIVVCYS
jgi:hypothetical protein